MKKEDPLVTMIRIIEQEQARVSPRVQLMDQVLSLEEQYAYLPQGELNPESQAEFVALVNEVLKQ